MYHHHMSDQFNLLHNSAAGSSIRTGQPYVNQVFKLNSNVTIQFNLHSYISICVSKVNKRAYESTKQSTIDGYHVNYKVSMVAIH